MSQAEAIIDNLEKEALRKEAIVSLKDKAQVRLEAHSHLEVMIDQVKARHHLEAMTGRAEVRNRLEAIADQVRLAEATVPLVDLVVRQEVRAHLEEVAQEDHVNLKN